MMAARPSARSHKAHGNERRTTSRPQHRRPDPNCPTCKGTGRFVSAGKAHEVPVHCPRCLGSESVRALPVDLVHDVPHRIAVKAR
jgi:DnaJ-class molecular chaperone